MNKQEEIKNYNYEFDFSLKINDNILIYREFNVKGYNDDFRESLEARELSDEIMGNKAMFVEGVLPEAIKKASIVSLWDYYSYDKFLPTKSHHNTFTFEIRKKQGSGKEVILSSIFEGVDFQNNLRIDLKDSANLIKDTIKEYMSRKQYTKAHLGRKLKRTNKIGKREFNECKQG